MKKLTEADIAKIIKAVEQRYNQTQISKAFGVSQARISQILKERGISKPKKNRSLDITAL
ncbi:helix-turn-helix domain-containing protein [Aeromonas veronii]|uniref:helix-turn-helix domain-containing protein n=1 Tax=Aeromonas veronii TaxID=654 RepID=UPI003D1B7A5B